MTMMMKLLLIICILCGVYGIIHSSNTINEEDWATPPYHMRSYHTDTDVFRLQLFKNAIARNATCNDGTPSGYYITRVTNSTKWIIYLFGGGLCYDVDSCTERAKKTPFLVSSTPWPQTMTAQGILSNATTNEFRDFNRVMVIYCTSDLYSGSAHNPILNWAFNGAYVIPAVLEDLHTDLQQATDVLFTGGSAGGIGTFMNWPYVYQQLHGTVARVRALPDAGYFLDVPPYSKKALPVSKMLKEAYALFNGVVPSECRAALGDEAYLCYSGPVVYKYMPEPAYMFIAKSQTDTWTLGHDGCDKPFDASKIEWMTELAAEVRLALLIDKPINAFSANCPYHTSIQLLYDHLKINETTLHSAIVDWYFHDTQAAYVDACVVPLCNPTCV